MTREVQGILLVLVGGAVVRITAEGTYLWYVRASMKPWLYASGGVLILLGALALVDAIRRHRTGARVEAPADMPAEVVAVGAGGDAWPEELAEARDHDADDHHGHAHGPGGPRIAWLLLLPVLAIFLVAPPPLGAFTAARQTTNAATTATVSPPPLPPGDPVDVTVGDYVSRAVWDDGRTLRGRHLRIVGFVTPNPAGGWWLTRLTLTCCAADAVTSRTQVVGVPDEPANTWFTVTGVWVPGGGTNSDSAVPLFKVDGLQRILQPANPYE